MSDPLDIIVGFLDAIGIAARPGTVADDAFLPAIRIENGGLVFDAQQLRWPGDLLHEAGHIAVTPPAGRPGLGDALAAAEAAPHGGEVEAMAWSWAAAVHLGLAPEVLFHPEGYKGQSVGLMLTYSQGVYPGAFGLAQTGMTLVGAAAVAAGVAPYPNMLRWLRAA